MSQRLFLALTTLVVAVTAGATAHARSVEFYGPHPIESSHGSGLCVIEGAHVHVYEPADKVLYVEDGPYLTFVGDPTEFEPAAPRHAYYGHHPVWWTAAPGEHYCYITGAHHHGYAPAAGVTFELKGGAYWYVGAHPRWYEVKRKKHRHVDDHYARRGVIVRPVVAVEPPRGWLGVHLSVDLGGAELVIGSPRPAPIAPVVIEHHHHDDHPGRHLGHHKDKHKDKHKHKGGHGHEGKGKRGRGGHD